MVNRNFKIHVIAVAYEKFDFVKTSIPAIVPAQSNFPVINQAIKNVSKLAIILQVIVFAKCLFFSTCFIIASLIYFFLLFSSAITSSILTSFASKNIIK